MVYPFKPLCSYYISAQKVSTIYGSIIRCAGFTIGIGGRSLLLLFNSIFWIIYSILIRALCHADDCSNCLCIPLRKSIPGMWKYNQLEWSSIYVCVNCTLSFNKIRWKFYPCSTHKFFSEFIQLKAINYIHVQQLPLLIFLEACRTLHASCNDCAVGPCSSEHCRGSSSGFNTMKGLRNSSLTELSLCGQALSGVDAELKRNGLSDNTALQSALDTQFLLQIGIFTAVPMIVNFILEQGVLRVRKLFENLMIA